VLFFYLFLPSGIPRTPYQKRTLPREPFPLEEEEKVPLSIVDLYNANISCSNKCERCGAIEEKWEETSLTVGPRSIGN
jgi:hypothetical protein